MSYTISLCSIKNILYEIGLQRSATSPNVTNETLKKTSPAAASDVIRKVGHMIVKLNPSTQRGMTSKLGESKETINNIINNTLKATLRKKCIVHQLKMAQIEKRRARSWKLYLKLKCNQWKNFVTSDEEMFYLGRSYG
jgi:hypothetical protein